MGNTGRNEFCHCGSGKKYKKCCLPKDEEQLLREREEQEKEQKSDDWGYELFSARFPEIAKRETRSIVVTDREQFNLPEEVYVFHEMYCQERRCDCRRVFFYVTASPHHDVKAVVCYGWESADFYKEWFKDDDPDWIAEMQGPALNFGSPQSKYAPGILKLVKNVLIKDQDYMERVKRHYEMFKANVDKRR